MTRELVSLFVRGPDALRLLSEHAVNSFATFEPGKAKQYIAVNHDRRATVAPAPYVQFARTCYRS